MEPKAPPLRWTPWPHQLRLENFQTLPQTETASLWTHEESSWIHKFDDLIQSTLLFVAVNFWWTSLLVWTSCFCIQSPAFWSCIQPWSCISLWFCFLSPVSNCLHGKSTETPELRQKGDQELIKRWGQQWKWWDLVRLTDEASCSFTSMWSLEERNRYPAELLFINHFMLLVAQRIRGRVRVLCGCDVTASGH